MGYNQYGEYGSSGGGALQTIVIIGGIIGLIAVAVWARQHPEEAKATWERWSFRVREWFYTLQHPGQQMPPDAPAVMRTPPPPPPIVDENGRVIAVVEAPPPRPYMQLPMQRVGDIGVQVDAWGALVMNKAHLAENNEALLGTMDALAKREVPGLALDVGGLVINQNYKVTRPHVFIYQKLAETGSEATVVLRIAARGPDLEVSWRLNENNPKRARNYKKWGNRFVFWGVCGLAISCPLLFVGIGEFTGPIALAMWGFGVTLQRIPQRQTLVSLYDQFDSRALAATVQYCLMQALASLEVDAGDFLLLTEFNKSGLSKLGEFKLEWTPGA